MSLLPKALEELIEQLGHLPGVGPRTAERYALSILKGHTENAGSLADALKNLHSNVRYCEKTFALTEPDEPISRLYSDPKRDKKLVAVVENALDVVSLEKTGHFKGTYHVLGGLISPIDGISPDQLTISQLIKRVDEDKVDELIIATNASVEGESTALYIQKQLEGKKIKITRLARGLPVGIDIEYADQLTLSRALENRQAL